MNPIIITHDSLGGLWVVGWLFTLGYLHLSFWRAVLALIVWPYFLGKKLHHHDSLCASK